MSAASNVEKENDEIIKMTKIYNARELFLTMLKIKCKNEQKQNVIILSLLSYEHLSTSSVLYNKH